MQPPTPYRAGARSGLCLLALLAGLLAPGPGAGQSALPGASLVMPSAAEPLTITADQVTWLRGEDVLELEGNVVVVHPDYRVNADFARALLKEKTIHASGNVVVTRIAPGGQKEILRAREVNVSTEQGTGWMVNARLELPFQDQVFHFQGDRFEKLDDHTYRIESGTFTWCQCAEGQTPDWAIQAKRIEADTRGDAVARGARIFIRNRPFAAVPYFRYPIGQERRSGFLLPGFESGSVEGFHFELPYYYVINRSLDATLAPRYIERRGLDLGGEFRYNYGELAAGEVRGFIIQDQLDPATRSGVRLQHRTDLGDTLTAAADLAVISDNEAVIDFDHRGIGRPDQRALESILLLAYHQPSMNLSAEFSYFDDLMGGDLRESPFGEDRDDQMVQRLPAIQYTLLTRPLIEPLLFDVQGYAAQYYRQDQDLGRGQLLTLMPRLAIPWRFAEAVDFWAAAGYREWFLVPDPGFDKESTYTGRPEAELYASAQWERIYTGADQVLRHQLRPALVAFYAGEPDQEPNDDFFASLVPDQPTALAGAYLDTRLWHKKAANRPGLPVEMARLEFTQLYDFEADEPRDLRLEGRLGDPTPWRVNLDSYYSWQENNFSRVLVGLGYRYGNRFEVQTDYRNTYETVRAPFFDLEGVPDEAVSGTLSFRPFERHQFRYQAFYSMEFNEVVSQSLDYNYLGRQQCWRLYVRVLERIRPDDPEGPHEISGMVNVSVAGAPGP